MYFGYAGGLREALLLLVWLAASVALVVWLCRASLGFTRLRHGARALAEGDLSHQVDPRGMIRTEKALAADLNRIGEGLSRAVEARMRSERMKTDLITNVSHDLKTPLTSIVNYVELLKKEPLHNETAEGYVAVLDRQAQRLKKLTEDVVEASKASSGALHVQLAPVDVAELLRQCAAEYGDRFGRRAAHARAAPAGAPRSWCWRTGACSGACSTTCSATPSNTPCPARASTSTRRPARTAPR